ncbi:hypothetical protein ACE1CI_18650, partial [Aerosakkonemataceae cyanobacterium BLCC-F50]
CLITEKFELIPVHTLLDVGTGRLYGYNPYPVRLLWLAIAHFVRNAGFTTFTGARLPWGVYIVSHRKIQKEFIQTGE